MGYLNDDLKKCTINAIENCTYILLSLCVAKISLLILGLVGACICVSDRQRGDEKLQIEIVLTYLDITWYMNKKN